MAEWVKVMVLWCGQGMATLVEVYLDGNTNHAPDHLALVDFGGSKTQGSAAAEYVKGKLNDQHLAGKDPKIDYTVVSHQDSDHLSLLPTLTDEIADMDVEGGGIFAGGSNWSARNTRTVQKFADKLDFDESDLEFDAAQMSHYAKRTSRPKLGHLWGNGTVELRLLVSGLKVSKAPPDIARNASSSVVVVENGDRCVILPGDATYHTMSKATEIVQAARARGLFPSAVFGLEVPHHGALRTAVENYNAQYYSSSFNWTIITNFAKELKPQKVGASAGIRNTHCHPVAEVLAIFNAYVRSKDSHNYVAWEFDSYKSTKHEGWYTYKTEDEVFTTVRETKVDGLVGGHIEINLPPPNVVLAPDEIIRFIPVGRLGDLDATTDPEPPVYAPAPE
ncbi:MAG TPA: hypothetical protein VFB78_17130 [Acidimicrobiales bacterium]|nr:hypothetical protein [Acidimicrobiales bacterium]